MINLYDIQSPEFLKALSKTELAELAEDIRVFLIEKLSVTGGHLASNLGAVELTIALHSVFESPYDKLIFDVGHQTYVHKILTGRAKEFDSLRKKHGLSGFLKYAESEHDVWEAGHSSTSISAATGYLHAKLAGEKIGEIVSIIGDGSIQNGLALSAINYLSTLKKGKVIIVLNDNDMSISKNVGGLANMLNKIRIKRSYLLLKRLTPKFVSKLLRKFKKAMTSMAYGDSLFSELGYRYIGPIDGHNINALMKYLRYAKQQKSSIILHVKTMKGKGYPFAEGDLLGTWHGTGPFCIETGEPLKKLSSNIIPWSNGMSNIMIEEAKKNERIRLITPAMIVGSGLNEFENQLPEQLIDVGISEEHAVVMASAMVKGGLKPVCMIYSTFLQRSYDALNHDIARPNMPVVFLIDRSGIVGADGDTHQGVFDISFLSHLPNFVIMMPKDLNEARDLIHFALYEVNAPIAIRFPRGETNRLIENKDYEKIELGKFEIILALQDVNVITYGPDVCEFKEEIINQNKKIGLIHARFIKPIDLELLNELSNKTLIIYEEVILKGSLSSAIIEANQDYQLNINIIRYGINDEFVEHGDVRAIKDEKGLNIKKIISTMRE